MSKHQTITSEFDCDLKNILPRLRVYALALTHDRDRADDLVQQTAVKALIGRKSFRPGTNFGGWLFRIQRNEFISGLRRLRPTVCFDEVSTDTLSHPPRQESGLLMREFVVAFRHLAPGTRQALLLATVEGHSYKQIAKPAGISVGTVKSRISRGRSALQQMLAEKSPSPRSPALPMSKRPRSPDLPGRRMAGPLGRDPSSSSTSWARAT
jgi:RNA polymerase sigma-70 factor, ECF subfamily